MWENVCRAKQTTEDNIIQCTRIACWIPKTTNTHSQYVIIVAFALQQWLQERASLLRYHYIDCLVHYCVVKDVQLSFVFLFKQ